MEESRGTPGALVVSESLVEEGEMENLMVSPRLMACHAISNGMLLGQAIYPFDVLSVLASPTWVARLATLTHEETAVKQRAAVYQA